VTWLFIPFKASNFSQALECLEKDCEPGSTTWASRIAPCATLSGKLTPAVSWSRAWKKAAWMRHLNGPTFAPSTLVLGVERLIASLPDSHAKTCLSQVSAPDLTGSALDSSLKSLGLQTIAVRGSSFWRTSQASLLPPPPLWTRKKASSTKERPPESWENWPTSGGMRSGSLFPRPTWAPAMAGQDGSASRGNWTTPDVCSGARDMSKIDPEAQKRAETKRTTGLPTEVTMWQPPQTSDKNGARAPDGKRSLGTNTQAVNWMTPHGMSGMDANGKAGAGGEFAKQVTNWPTPASRDSKGANSEEHAMVTGGHMDQLANFVAYSPLVQTNRDGLQSSTPSRGSIQRSASKSSTTPRLLSRRLNPYFVERLMGWPLDWTSTTERNASNAAETELWRSALRSQLSNFFGDPGL